MWMIFWSPFQTTSTKESCIAFSVEGRKTRWPQTSHWSSKARRFTCAMTMRGNNMSLTWSRRSLSRPSRTATSRERKLMFWNKKISLNTVQWQEAFNGSQGRLVLTWRRQSVFTAKVARRPMQTWLRCMKPWITCGRPVTRAPPWTQLPLMTQLWSSPMLILLGPMRRTTHRNMDVSFCLQMRRRQMWPLLHVWWTGRAQGRAVFAEAPWQPKQAPQIHQWIGLASQTWCSPKSSREKPPSRSLSHCGCCQWRIASHYMIV